METSWGSGIEIQFSDGIFFTFFDGKIFSGELFEIREYD